MNDFEKNSNSNSKYPDELVKYLQDVYYVYDIDFEKKRAVWDTSNNSSVVRIIADTLSGILAPDIGGEESESRDYSDHSSLCEQALNEPLQFIQKICKTSTRLYPTAYAIVQRGGISTEEAINIVDISLQSSRHTRQELQSVLDLDKVANAALNALKTMKREEDIESIIAAKDLKSNMTGIILPPSERQN